MSTAVQNFRSSNIASHILINGYQLTVNAQSGQDGALVVWFQAQPLQARRLWASYQTWCSHH